MSQYAFYLAKKEKSPCCVAMYNSRRNDHNGFELGNLFGIHCDRGFRHYFFQKLYNFLTNWRLKKYQKQLSWFGIRIIFEAQNYDFNPQLLDPSPFLSFNYFWGGWHSEKYFISIKNKVKNTFLFPPIQDDECLRVIRMITNSENSVSLHVRRGDYLNTPADCFYQFEGVATLNYYKEAVNKICTLAENCKFFVFSDDIDWCQTNLHLSNAYYVVCNTGKNSWRDMYLMTLCKHHINANSTFSWWGAWLSQKKGYTICPKSFIRTIETKDIYPQDWIKIPSSEL